MKILRCLLVLMVFLMSEAVLAQPHVKLHKDKVSISAPNEAGIVLLRGGVGAITSSSAVRLRVKNLSSDRETTVALGPDGSFEALILAGSGDKLRATANNEEKKRSQGTFTVPAEVAGGAGAVGEGAVHATGVGTGPDEQGGAAGAENSTAVVPADESGRGRSLVGATESLNRLNVLILVTDPVTNEVVAVRQLSGRSRTYAADLADLGKRIVDRLEAALSRDLYVGPARAKLRAPVLKPRGDSSVKKAQVSAPGPTDGEDVGDANALEDEAGSSKDLPAEPLKGEPAAVLERAAPQNADG